METTKQMTIEEWYAMHLAAPQLEVIDCAIRRLERGDSRTVGDALMDALSINRATKEVATYGPQAFKIYELYKNQYRQFCIKHYGHLPIWWGSSLFINLKIKSLKLFRQACIDAAK